MTVSWNNNSLEICSWSRLLFKFILADVNISELKIQSVTHDSIEDARTALALYQKYCDLKASGELVMALQGLYQAGKKAQWKVPGEEEEEDQ